MINGHFIFVKLGMWLVYENTLNLCSGVVVLWGLVYQYTVHARQLKGKIVLHKKSGFCIGQVGNY